MVLIWGLCSTCIMQFYVNSVDIHAVGRHFNVQVNHCFWMTSFDLFFWIVKLTASSSKQKIGRFFLYSSTLQKKKVYIPKAWTNQRNKQSDEFSFSGTWELPFPIAIQLYLQVTIESVFSVMKWSPDQNASGRGWPPRNALNSTSDLSGCENGASWDAPLMVAKDRILP
jgi:hypothetical protein